MVRVQAPRALPVEADSSRSLVEKEKDTAIHVLILSQLYKSVSKKKYNLTKKRKETNGKGCEGNEEDMYRGSVT